MFKIMKKLVRVVRRINDEVNTHFKELAVLKIEHAHMEREMNERLAKDEREYEEGMRQHVMMQMDTDFKAQMKVLEQDRKDGLAEVEKMYKAIEDEMSPGMKEYLGIHNN